MRPALELGWVTWSANNANRVPKGGTSGGQEKGNGSALFAPPERPPPRVLRPFPPQPLTKRGVRLAAAPTTSANALGASPISSIRLPAFSFQLPSPPHSRWHWIPHQQPRLPKMAPPTPVWVSICSFLSFPRILSLSSARRCLYASSMAQKGSYFQRAFCIEHTNGLKKTFSTLPRMASLPGYSIFSTSTRPPDGCFQLLSRAEFRFFPNLHSFSPHSLA